MKKKLCFVIVLYMTLGVVIFRQSDAILTSSTLCDTQNCRCDAAWMRIVCSCADNDNRTIVLRSSGSAKIPNSITAIQIENCSYVHVKENALSGLTNLRSVEFMNINELVLETYSFQWNESLYFETTLSRGIIIRIHNSSIPQIPSYAFKGRIELISLKENRINLIDTFAFVSLHGLERLQIIDCLVIRFEPQAFKKFSMNSLHVEGNQLLQDIPSRTMVEIEVKREAVFKRLLINTLKSSAVMIHSPSTFRLQDSYVNHMEGEALRVTTTGPVIIQNNTFVSLDVGAFIRLSVRDSFRSKNGYQDLIFENNTISKFKNGSLAVDGVAFEPKFYRVYINQTCSCEALESWHFQLSSYPPDPVMQPKQQITTSVVQNGFWCLQEKTPSLSRTHIRFLEYNNIHCGYTTKNIYILIIIIIASLLGLLGIAVLIVFLYRRKHSHNKKEWINVPNNDVSNENGGKKKIKMVVPDGRTYRETELHVIVERAEPIIQQNYDPEYLNKNNIIR